MGYAGSYLSCILLEEEGIVKRKTIRFLIGSVCGIILFCILIFAWMTGHMHKSNEDSMKEICQMYMSEISYQIQSHFYSVTDLRLDMEQAIVRRYPPEGVAEYSQALEDELTFAAQIRNYELAALYAEDGDMDIVYGEPVTIINEEPFRQSLLAGESKLVSGVTESGKMMLLFGINASYPMQAGGRSMALIVGLPVEYLNYTMDLAVDETLVYSHIIRKDGSFVLKNDDIDGDNYYEWLLNKGEFEDQTPEVEVEHMRRAVEAGETYSVIATLNGQRRNIYCEPLEKTEWSVVTIMLHGKLDEAVYDLGRSHQTDAIIACTLIVATLLLLYVIYFNMSMKQMKSLEEAQQEAERANRAKSQFLSDMSHDIRTPMNAIVGMTAIASTNMDKPEVVQDCLRKVTLSSRHLLGLINDVLDMSKIESGKLTLSMRPVSLRDIFENIVNIVIPQIKEKNQRFDIFISNVQVEDVLCDDVRLNQVLINLLSNAIKFTPEAGYVYVSLTQEASDKGAEYVRTHIRVHDTGIGMSKEFSEKIFQAFSRENSERVHHTEGTGLGMAITKHIVDKMGGTIEVNSEKGKGTEFHVILDLAKVKEKELVLSGGELLVVDDDEQLCHSTVENLKAIGIRADCVQSGEAAIAAAVKRHEENNDYQMILLDWQMPEMDGIETARRLKERLGSDVSILLISAYDWGDIEEEARAAGVSGFISKPLFMSTLYYGLSPYMNGEYKAQEEDSVEEEYDGGEKRLLVAEDYDMNWEILETLLPEYGFLLERAENGQVCVDKLNASEEGYYSAVLMDLRMPVMNGFDATRLIRASGRKDCKLPIIAMTADAFSDDVSRCLECGMDAHVAKPIDMHDLLSVLKRFL